MHIYIHCICLYASSFFCQMYTKPRFNQSIQSYSDQIFFPVHLFSVALSRLLLGFIVFILSRIGLFLALVPDYGHCLHPYFNSRVDSVHHYSHCSYSMPIRHILHQFSSYTFELFYSISLTTQTFYIMYKLWKYLATPSSNSVAHIYL